MRTAFGALLVAGLLAGCQAAVPAVPAVATTSGPLSADAARQAGDALVARGDYAGAAERYRAAVAAYPDDLMLRFALGSVSTHLDRRDDAVASFMWVVAHGDPRVPEVATARQWLETTGVLAAAAPGAPAPLSATVAAPADAAGVGAVRGQSAWPGLRAGDRRPTLLVKLVGDDAATQGSTYRLRVGLGKPFVMSNIPAGAYRVTGDVDGVLLWETRAVVRAGQEVAIDFTPETSSVSPNDFRPKQDG
jgi:hypothetical protein